MRTTFHPAGKIFSTLDRFRNRFDPVNRSSTDIRRAVVNEKLKRSSSKLYRSTGDLLDDDADDNTSKYSGLSSDVLGSMLSNRTYGPENVAVPMSSLRPPSRQGYVRASLPALIEISEMTEDEFVRKVVGSDTERLQFQLGPTFLVYMAARFYLSPYYRNTLSDEQKKQRTRIFFIKVVERFRMIIKEYRLSKESLAFWLANSSELLNIMKQDRELSVVTAEESQQFLSETVERTFELFTSTLKDQLAVTLATFIDTRISDKTACDETIFALDDTMRLLRRCRLNIALTIQLFSQLFHFINAYLFNWLVSEAGSLYCSTAFGVRLNTRLRTVNDWAEKQGLEVAVECHMDRIHQAVTLLTTPKRMDQIANLGTTCYKLNSLQVRYLLKHIVLDVGEEPVSEELINSVVRLAESLADVTAKQEGMKIQLEEQLVLPLPFLLPQDEYFIDQLLGVPQSIVSYVTTLQAQGLCVLIQQQNSNGWWKVHFSDDIPNDPVLTDGGGFQMSNSRESRPLYMTEPYGNMSLRSTASSNPYDSPRMKKHQNVVYAEGRNPDIALVSLNRGTSSIGLSIVAAQGIGERSIGIYIKKVVEGSAAARDGRLQPGDQLLSVNGQSLVGISQEEAASKMGAAGPNITFEVNKQAARYNGLADWLNCPPTTSSQVPNYLNAEQVSVSPYGLQPNSSALQNGRNESSLSQYNVHPYVRHQPAPSKAQASSMGIGYNERPEAQYGAIRTHNYQQGRNGMLNNGYSQQDSHLRNSARSMSATELYQNLGTGSLTNSMVSLPPPRGLSGAVSSHVYNHGNTHGSAHQNIPSRYRTGLRDAIRPTVIQPLRPSASPRNLRRGVPVPTQVCGSVPSTSESLLQAKSNSMSMPQHGQNGQSAATADYINVQSSDQYLSGPLSDSSFSSSASHPVCFTQTAKGPANVIPQSPTTLSTAPLSPVVAASPNEFSSEYKLSPNELSQDSLVMPTSSGINGSRFDSNSSPNIRNDSRGSPENQTKRAVGVTVSKRDELNEELDKLELKGSAMTEADQRKYRQLVNELSKIREPLSFKNPSKKIKTESGEGSSGKKTRFEQNEDNDKLSSDKHYMETDSGNQNSEITSVTRENDKSTEEVIGELQREMSGMTVETPAERTGEVENTTQPDSSKNTVKKKEVQWNEENLETSEDDSKRLLFKDAGEAEPRTQVLGTQEVYRDPRLRRLNEIQARKIAAQPNVDGANLRFRDKMRLFAEQAGEKSLKNRYKTSSAQREIEQSLD